jgi:hypothetical protein
MKNVDLKKIELYEREIKRHLPSDFIVRDFPDTPVEYLFAQLNCLAWQAAIDMDERHCRDHDIETHIGMEDRVYQFNGRKIRLVLRSSSDGKLLKETRLYPCVRTLEEGIALCRVFGPLYAIAYKKRRLRMRLYRPKRTGYNMGVSCP